MNYKLIFATLSGSHLYGTSRPDSDIDIRGVCFSPDQALLGLSKFEQYMPNGSIAKQYSMNNFGIESDDITIYSVSKFFELCLKANPNILELLFCDKPLFSSPVWDKIIENRHLFLSTKCIHTFSGYAFAQMKRIQGHKRWNDNPPVKPDPLEFGMSYGEKGEPRWSNINLKNSYNSKIKDYQLYTAWLKSRNPSRRLLEDKYGYDTKHATHLYRLMIEAKYLLATGKMSFPFLGEDKEKLLSVLNGEVPYDEALHIGKSLKDELLKIDTSLPRSPDFNGAEQLLIDIQKENIK